MARQQAAPRPTANAPTRTSTGFTPVRPDARVFAPIRRQLSYRGDWWWLASLLAIDGVVCGFGCGLRQIEQGGLLVSSLPSLPMCPGGWLSGRVSVGGVGVCADDAVEGAALVAVTVEAADEVPTVLMAESDGYVLG